MKDLKYSDLRKKAEKVLREKGIQNESFYQQSLEKLIEELNIYQIELEHQNDELRQTQQNLESVNQKYTDLYHNAPVGYFTIDKNYTIINVNDTGARLLNNAKKAIINTLFTHFIHPDFQDQYYHHHRQILTKNKSGTCELKIISQSNQEYYVQLESIPTKIKNNDEIAIRTAVFDISDRKKVEKENQNQLSILKNISDSVIVTDMEGYITFWNRGAEEIFGYTPKEMLGKTPALLYPDMDPSKLDYDLEKIIAGEDYVGEWKGRNKNNQIIWLNIRTSVLLDVEKKPIGLIGVAKDVTERKKQEIYQLRLASIVEFSDDAIESMDLEGNILSWNKGAEKVYGYRADEIIGKNALKLYPKELENELKLNIDKVKQGHLIDNAKSRRKRKDGEIIDVAITFSPVKNNAGEILGVSVITRDISEQIRNQRALEESELKYQTIYEDSGDGILLMNKHGIIDCNSQVCQLLGYEKEEILMQSPVDFSPEKQDGGKTSKVLGEEYIQKAFKSGYHAFNWQHHKKDGNILNTRVSLKQIELNGEKVLLALMHDLTDIFEYQKKIQERNEEIIAQNEEYQALNEELHEANNRLNIINKHIELSENKFRTAFKTSPDALTISRLSDGLWVELNESFTDITGFTEDDVKGKTSKDIDIWANNKDRDFLIKELAQKGAVSNYEFQFRMKDGSLKTGLISADIIAINNEDCILSITRDISERRRLQAILEQSEEKYRFLVESVHAISWEFDIIKDQWTYVSPQSKKLLGYQPEEWANLDFWTNNIHPDEREWALNYCFECAAKGESHLFEYRFKNKEGNYVWLRDIVSVEMKDDKPYKLRGLMFDITDQKKNEEELKILNNKLKKQNVLYQKLNKDLKIAKEKAEESEKNLRFLFDNMIQGVVYHNPSGEIIWANDAAARILGLSLDQLYGKTSLNPRWKSIHEDGTEYRGETHPDQITIKTKKTVRNSIMGVFIPEKNDYSWININSIPRFNDNNELMQIVVTFEDITEIKKAKEKAEESQNYSKIIAELSKKIIQPELSVEEIGDLIYQQALTLTLSNYGYVGTIDLETEELVSHTMKEMMPGLCNVKEKRITFPKGKDGYNGLYGHALNTFEPFFTNNPADHKASKGLPDGHVAITNFLTVPVVVNNILLGQIALANKPTPYNIADLEKIKDLANIYGIAVYRKNMEGDLIKSKEHAEESDRLKSAFLANMSHEIRTPMNSILGFSELFRQTKVSNQRKENYLKIIHTSGKHLVKIIDDIIDFSKIESGQLVINRANVNIKELFTMLYDEYIQVAQNKNPNIELKMEIPDEDYIIYTDEIRVKQIMGNFLTNSIKFTEKGQIVFGYQKAGKNQLKFFVKDTGIGIPQDKLETIFERFQQADDSTTRKYGGTGLGLTISKNLAELLDGEIGVKSKENTGAEFYFTLPDFSV